MASPLDQISDDELLGRLSAAFPIEPAEPDPASLRQLSIAVAELQRQHAPAPVRSPRRVRVTLPRRLSPVVIAGTLAGALVTGTGISYAVGVPAVRSIVRTVGLANPAPTTPALPPAPVPSPAVSAARQAESTLQQALSGNQASSGQISHDTSELARRLAEVGDDHGPGADRTDDDGHRLIAQACQHLEGLPQSGAGSSGRGDDTSGGRDGSTPGGSVCSDATSPQSGSSPGGPASNSPTSPGTSTPDHSGRDGNDNNDTSDGTGDHDGRSGGDGTDNRNGNGTVTVPTATTPGGFSGPSGGSSGSSSGSGSSGGTSGGTSGGHDPTSGQSGSSGQSSTSGGGADGSVPTTADTSGGQGGDHDDDTH
jgi:hypothetical protein